METEKGWFDRTADLLEDGCDAVVVMGAGYCMYAAYYNVFYAAYGLFDNDGTNMDVLEGVGGVTFWGLAAVAAGSLYRHISRRRADKERK